MSPRATTTASGRLSHIDALRGLAVLLVLVSHVVEQSPESPLKALLFRQLGLGHLGVCLFFMISGYVVTLSINNATPTRFWTRRLLRLYPAFWVSVLVVLLVTALGLASPHGQDFRTAPLQTVVANLSMAPSLFGYDYLMPVYWSLESELVFYLLVTIFAAAGLLGRIRLIALLTLLLALGVQLLAGRQFAALPLYLGLMFTGATLFYRDQGSLSDRDANRVLLACAVTSSLLALGGGGLWRLLVIVGFAAALRYKPAPRLLIWYGKISYSLYLLHLIVIAVVSTGSFWLDWPLWVVGSTALAWLSYRLVERPSISLGRRLTTVFAKGA